MIQSGDDDWIPDADLYEVIQRANQSDVLCRQEVSETP